jgi:hypothetical protein
MRSEESSARRGKRERSASYGPRLQNIVPSLASDYIRGAPEKLGYDEHPSLWVERGQEALAPYQNEVAAICAEHSSSSLNDFVIRRRELIPDFPSPQLKERYFTILIRAGSQFAIGRYIKQRTECLVREAAEFTSR